MANRPYMEANCPVACREIYGACKDRHDHCPIWVGLGECKANKKKMYNYCAKSCGVCDGGTPLGEEVEYLCEDKHADCEYFADAGECKANPDWMKQNCIKSCNLCELIDLVKLVEKSAAFGVQQEVAQGRTQKSVGKLINETIVYMESDEVTSLEHHKKCMVSQPELL